MNKEFDCKIEIHKEYHNGYNFSFRVELYKKVKKFYFYHGWEIEKVRNYATDVTALEYILTDFKEVRFLNYKIEVNENK